MILQGGAAREFIRGTMKHFTESELECRCGCGSLLVDTELLKLLEQMRTITAKPIRLVSCCRCEQHNAEVGGKKRSEHLTGQAADLSTPTSAHKWTYARLAFQLGVSRIGIGESFIHLGVSSTLPQHVLWTY